MALGMVKIKYTTIKERIYKNLYLFLFLPFDVIYFFASLEDKHETKKARTKINK